MKKVLLIIAIALVAAGLLITACAFIFFEVSTSNLMNVTYETNTYPVEGDFANIEIDTHTTDIFFARAEDGNARIVCEEPEKLHHAVKVEDGTLKVALEGKKNFSFYTKDMTMTVYLPATEYESLRVNNSTGDVTLSKPFVFDNIKIDLSTGGIFLNDLSATTIDLTTSTGKIEAERIDCSGTISVQVSTGNTVLTDVTCKNLKSTGSTGNLILGDVVASEGFDLERSTGNIRFARADAETITAKTSTGKVTGTLRSDKIFITKTSTGSINVPETTSGGVCKITTSTGKIEIGIEK